MLKPTRKEILIEMLRFSAISLLPNYTSSFTILYLAVPKLELGSMLGISVVGCVVPTLSYGALFYGGCINRDDQVSLSVHSPDSTTSNKAKIRRGLTSFATVILGVGSGGFSEMLGTVFANLAITTDDPDQADQQFRNWVSGIAIPMSIVCSVLANRAYGYEGQQWHSPVSDIVLTIWLVLKLFFQCGKFCVKQISERCNGNRARLDFDGMSSAADKSFNVENSGGRASVISDDERPLLATRS